MIDFGETKINENQMFQMAWEMEIQEIIDERNSQRESLNMIRDNMILEKKEINQELKKLRAERERLVKQQNQKNSQLQNLEEYADEDPHTFHKRFIYEQTKIEEQLLVSEYPQMITLVVEILGIWLNEIQSSYYRRTSQIFLVFHTTSFQGCVLQEFVIQQLLNLRTFLLNMSSVSKIKCINYLREQISEYKGILSLQRELEYLNMHLIPLSEKIKLGEDRLIEIEQLNQLNI